MKILYYDCFCGISGDMNLAALLDLGVDRDYLVKELSGLGLDSEYEIIIKKGIKKGISGTKVDVLLKNGHHSHGHDEEGQHHHHGAGHRNLKDIEKIINSSSLSERVKSFSLKMFRIIARAEAKVHGKPVDEVHFHEVGATDSIVDLVGAAIAMDRLNVDKIMASSVQVGGGFVDCQHGHFPVPAPATVEILKDIPVKNGLVEHETTTPTGAAILAAGVDEFSDSVEFTVRKTGYGLGTKDFDVPNVLRVYLAETEGAVEREEQYVLEANIDDMNPELYGYVEERLFGAGALDVFKTPVIMKKGRPAVKLSVLTDSAHEEEMLNIIFRETTSTGMRKYRVEKIMLTREFSKVKTLYGEVSVKKSYYRGEMVNFKAEYEECRRIAEEKKVPISEVYGEVNRAMRAEKDDKQ